jgi:hypothetical protein
MQFVTCFIYIPIINAAFDESVEESNVEFGHLFQLFYRLIALTATCAHSSLPRLWPYNVLCFFVHVRWHFNILLLLAFIIHVVYLFRNYCQSVEYVRLCISHIHLLMEYALFHNMLHACYLIQYFNALIASYDLFLLYITIWHMWNVQGFATILVFPKIAFS